jgi:hypothetical protein
MHIREDPYKRLLDHGFTKADIDSTLYNFIMYEIEQKKAYKKLSFFGKMKWHVRSYITRINYFFRRLAGRSKFD